MDVMQTQGEKTTSVLEADAAHIATDAARIAIDEAFSIMKEKGVLVEEDSGVNEDAGETEDAGMTEDAGATEDSDVTEDSTSEVKRLKVTLIRCNYTPQRCFLFSSVSAFFIVS